MIHRPDVHKDTDGMSDDKRAAGALKAFLKSVPEHRVVVPRSGLQWIVEHVPEGLSPQDQQAWVAARTLELLENAGTLPRGLIASVREAVPR
jgi:hypothetical protein